MKKYVLLCLFVFSLLSLVLDKPAWAVSLFEETFNVITNPPLITTIPCTPFYPLQEIKPDHNGYLKNISTYWTGAAEIHPNDNYITIFQDDGTSDGLDLGRYYLANTSSPSQPIASYSTTTASRIYLNEGTRYWVLLGYYTYGGNVSTTYEMGMQCNATAKPSLTGSSYIDDDAYLHWFITSASTSPQAIDFVATSSVMTPFSWWKVDVADDSEEIYKVGVQWGFISNAYTEQDEVLRSDLTWSASSLLPQFGLPGIVSVPKISSQAFQIGDEIYARAYLWDSNGTILASSTEWNFTISTSTFSDGLQKPVQQCPITSSTIFGWDYGQTTCQIFSYLFIPDEGNEPLAKIIVIKDDISLKPPFGYSQYLSVFDDVSSTIVSTTVELDWLKDITFFQYIRTILGIIIWILFFGYVIYRLTHLML